jgi:hypothetical protein
MCTCNKNPCVCCAPKESETKKTVREAFTCACSTAASAGLGHLGCVLSLAFSTAASTSASALGFAGGAAATVGGLLLWNKLRGKKASPMERKFVYGGAALGLAFSAYMHFGRAGHHHHTAVQACEAPAYIEPKVQDWYDRMDSSGKAVFDRNAGYRGETVEQALQALCLESPGKPDTTSVVVLPEKIWRISRDTLPAERFALPPDGLRVAPRLR